MSTPAKLDPTTFLKRDPWLEPFVGSISHRYDLFTKWKGDIERAEGGYDKFSKGYTSFGLNVQPDNSIVYREWAPNAVAASLIGEFSACLPFAYTISRLSQRYAHRCMEPSGTPDDQERVWRLGDHHPSR